MFVCQFFGYAVTYNDSFSTSHSGVCAFYCPCLEELSKLENDRTISPAVNQTETHFPRHGFLCYFTTLESSHQIVLPKQLLFQALAPIYTPYMCHIFHIHLRLGLLSGSLSFAADCFSLCVCVFACAYTSLQMLKDFRTVRDEISNHIKQQYVFQFLVSRWLYSAHVTGEPPKSTLNGIHNQFHWYNVSFRVDVKSFLC